MSWITLDTPGSTTVTIGAATTALLVGQCIGGGGGGAASTTSGGGGGGGGGCAAGALVVSVGQVVVFTVGSAGAGGPAKGDNGGPGVSSIIKVNGTTQFTGGHGGGGGPATAGGIAGTASTGASVTGASTHNGGTGGAGTTISLQGWGGGGGGGAADAPTSGAGGNGGTGTSSGAVGGTGGTSSIGLPGGTGGTGNKSGISGAPTSGTIPGGGGGGGGNNAGPAGAGGAHGQIAYSLQQNTQLMLEGIGRGALLLLGSPAAPITVPTSYWKMNEGNGATRIDQLSVQNLPVNGTVDQVTGLISYASQAQAASSGCFTDSLATALKPGTNPFSVAGWVYLSSIPGGGAYIAAYGNGSSTGWALYLDNLNQWILDIPGNGGVVSAVTPTTGQWHLVAAKYAASVAYISIDGAPWGAGTTVAGAPNADTAFALLNYYGGSAASPDMSVCELGIWINHQLTNIELAALYNNGLGLTYPAFANNGPLLLL